MKVRRKRREGGKCGKMEESKQGRRGGRRVKMGRMKDEIENE